MEQKDFQNGFIKRFGKSLLVFGAGLLMMTGCGLFPSSTLPVANAGPDQNVSVGSIVTLNGNESTSRTDSPLSYTWTQTGGTTVSLIGANSANPIFVAPNQAGTLTFQLVVNDVNGTSTPNAVTIAVTEPTSGLLVANAGLDQNVSTGSTVVLNGSGSTSQTGNPLLFAWTQIGGTPVILNGTNTANPTFVAPNQAETLIFQLVVSDGNDVSNPDTTAIRVGVPNSGSPVANAGLNQNVQAGVAVTLDGSASTSQTGSPLSFAWTQTGGTAVTLTEADTVNPTFVAPNQAGTLTFQLVVSDDNGVSNPDTVNITVGTPTSTPPIANAGFDQNVQAAATVTLNGSGSTSQTGSPLSFDWTQTGGTAVDLIGENTANPSFIAPNQTETLTFQLIVSDDNGVSDPDTVVITVTGPVGLFGINKVPGSRILSFAD